MMKKRRYTWISVLFFTGIAVAVTAYLCWDRDPICYGNVEKVKEGMTMAEVVKLLGCPPGDHTSGPIHMEFTHGDGSLAWKSVSPAELDLDNASIWYGDHRLIFVSFDADKKVNSKEILRSRRLPADWRLFMEWRVGLERTKHVMGRQSLSAPIEAAAPQVVNPMSSPK